MKIYHYSSETNEFLRESEAHLDPLETKRQGKPVYLIPANATLDAPPEVKAGDVPVMGAGGWEPVEDHRGETVYSIKDASSLVIEALGPIPTEYTASVPCPFPAWDGTKWIEDDAKAKAAEDAATKTRLAEIDQASIRGLRETVASMHTALAEVSKATTIAGIKDALAKIAIPVQVIEKEAQAQAEREKLG